MWTLKEIEKESYLVYCFQSVGRLRVQERARVWVEYTSPQMPNISNKTANKYRHWEVETAEFIGSKLLASTSKPMLLVNFTKGFTSDIQILFQERVVELQKLISEEVWPSSHNADYAIGLFYWIMNAH